MLGRHALGLLIALLLPLGAVHCGGAGLAGVSSGATAGGAETGSASSGSAGSESTGLEVGAPVDIPINIAKIIKGVDPTSLDFSTNTSTATIPAGFDAAGVLSGKILSCSDSFSTGKVGLVVDGALVHTVNFSNCTFYLPIDTKWQGELISIIVIENSESSQPLNIVVTKDNLLKIFLTGLKSILTKPIAISNDGTIVFHATDLDGELALGEVSIYGGDASVRLTDIDYPFLQMIHNLTVDTLFGVDTQMNLWKIGADSMTSLLNDSKPANRRFSVSPDEKWLVTNYSLTGDDGNLTENLAIVELANFDNVITYSNIVSNTSDLLPDWQGNGQIFATRKKADQYQLAFYGATVSSDNSITEEDIRSEAIYEGAGSTTNEFSATVGQPVGPTISASTPFNTPALFFTCDDDSGFTDLCLGRNVVGVEAIFEVTHVVGEDITSRRGDVSNIHVSPSFSFATFQYTDVGGTTHVGLYFIDEQAFILPIEGFFPMPYPTGDMVTYLCKDQDGVTQICLLILSNLFSGSSNASQLALLAEGVVKEGSCQSVNVFSQDSLGTEENVGWTTRVNLSAADGVLFSDRLCTIATTFVSIEKGTSSRPVYFQGTSAGTFTITATDNAGVLDSASTSINVRVNSNPPTKLLLDGGASIEAGFCRTYTIKTGDKNSEITKATKNISLLVSGGTAGSFYSDSACAQAITSTTYNSGAISLTIYFLAKTKVSSNMTVSDNAAELTAATIAYTIVSDPFFLVTNGPKTIDSGVCSGPYTLESQNIYRASAPLSAANTITFSTTTSLNIKNVNFYSDDACATVITTATMAAGTATAASYYFKAESTLENSSQGDSRITLSLTASDGTDTWPLIGGSESMPKLTVTP